MNNNYPYSHPTGREVRAMGCLAKKNIVRSVVDESSSYHYLVRFDPRVGYLLKVI